MLPNNNEIEKRLWDAADNVAKLLAGVSE